MLRISLSVVSVSYNSILYISYSAEFREGFWRIIRCKPGGTWQGSSTSDPPGVPPNQLLGTSRPMKPAIIGDPIRSEGMNKNYLKGEDNTVNKRINPKHDVIAIASSSTNPMGIRSLSGRVSNTESQCETENNTANKGFSASPEKM